MNGRRRKDEPFNPFAPNASQKARDRKERTQRQQPRQKPAEKPKPVNDLAERQKKAMEALKKQGQITKDEKPKVEKKVEKPKHKPSPQPKPAPKSSIKKPDSREDRLASLRAKSAATAQFAKEAKDAKDVASKAEATTVEAEAEVLNAEEEILPVTKDLEIEVPDIVSKKANTNVFKTIKTEIKKSDRRPKRRRPADKKGGGRQPQSRKLDRRKYLEYKYAARELLENDSVSEEHRSNILGQIWAKGERSGVDDAIEFINQKEAELIIPEEVAEEFRKMVKRYTTKR